MSIFRQLKPTRHATKAPSTYSLRGWRERKKGRKTRQSVHDSLDGLFRRGCSIAKTGKSRRVRTQRLAGNRIRSVLNRRLFNTLQSGSTNCRQKNISFTTYQVFLEGGQKRERENISFKITCNMIFTIFCKKGNM